MVHTTELDATIDKCLDGIDINNSCRQVYLRRMESIEECKRSTKKEASHKTTSSIDAALRKLRIEMVSLMDQDAGLMRQMLILNEKVEELKANNICQMSKESLDSQDSLYEEEGETNKYLMQSQDSVYHSDEQTDESLFDSKESIFNMDNQTSELFRHTADSLYQTDEFSSDEENIDIFDVVKSGSKTNPPPFVNNRCVSCQKNLVEKFVSYDTMFEKLLDFDDKI
ncbi:uncharacterized protein LOC110466601 [Mizuhopecten yessoensis]|uniref:uncharacterized protein LOC110466601 n=1 Tax=Mizuhopecten yessoensis TaxID=6573 RepID=UPI000B4577FC|nr:uncharacterized protein LOC110466601 [Mizuhopecten yessoensis]